jgi:hypothetical protein
MDDVTSNPEDVNNPTVEDAITDKLAYYWFLDAAKFMELYPLRHQTSSDFLDEADIQLNEAQEEDAWNTLKAPGSGRFLFGHSLLKYTDKRTCETAGIPKCICSAPKPTSLRGGKEYR